MQRILDLELDLFNFIEHNLFITESSIIDIKNYLRCISKYSVNKCSSRISYYSIKELYRMFVGIYTKMTLEEIADGILEGDTSAFIPLKIPMRIANALVCMRGIRFNNSDIIYKNSIYSYKMNKAYKIDELVTFTFTNNMYIEPKKGFILGFDINGMCCQIRRIFLLECIFCIKFNIYSDLLKVIIGFCNVE